LKEVAARTSLSGDPDEGTFMFFEVLKSASPRI
jgi:hypothetical protein